MEDFVNFKLAQKLKEKGFSLEKTEIYGKFDSDGLFHSQLYFNYIETMDCDEIIAPTISQVLKWLREEYRLHIEPRILTDSDVNADTYWKFSVLSARTGYTLYYEYNHIDDKRFETYEAAALAGVAYCLENLI